MRYQLMVKSIPGAPPVAGRAPNPAMLARNQSANLDEGREWSGDEYTEGPVSDPQAAFARFGDEQTEAWLDRHEDGTLIGWVRAGDDLWRYPDVEAWALDVDGAQLLRADAAPADPAAGAPADPAAADPFADPNADPNAAPAAEDPHIGEQAGDGFTNEADPATQEPDPTTPLEDPTNLPPGATPPAPDAAQQAAATDEAAEPEEFDNPFADMLEAAPGEPGDEKPADAPPAAPEPTTEDPDGPVTDEEPLDGEGGDDDDPFADADEPDPDAEDEDAEAEAAAKKGKKKFGGRMQAKHMPGKHNQDDHGNWADGGSVAQVVKKVGDALDTATGTGRKGAGPGPKAGSSTATPAPKAPPKKASLSPETVKALGTKDLEAMMTSGDYYDMATIEAAADELDSRDDIDARTRAFHKHTEPGSPQEHALFDSVIPDQWSAWAATGSKKVRKRSKAQEIEDAYHEFVQAQYARFRAENRPFFKREVAGKPPFDEESWFAGEAKRGAFLKKYGSEELQRFFAEDPPMSLSDFKAEFYPSYAKAKAQVGSRYLSEHG